MTYFDELIKKTSRKCLETHSIETFQLNIGLRCNHRCTHCHVQASPDRTEMMEWNTIQTIIKAAKQVRPNLIDITGGAPELNPNLTRIIEAFRKENFDIQVRTNLTVLLEPRLKGMMKFFADMQVKLVASLPCYMKEEVETVRGIGVFQRSIKALRLLNELGYGRDSSLHLDLVFNPEGPFLPPSQSMLESDYHRELSKEYGIDFDNLITITNMPIGRFKQQLEKDNKYESYIKLLRESFNPRTVDRLMCLSQISIGWDGTLYDCDFNLAMGLPISNDVPSHIQYFDPSLHTKRKIVTGVHCFGCTAGQGSSCSGALE